MKTTREKLFFGYIGLSALLSVLTVVICVFARTDWYYYLVTPVYLYEQLLLTAIVIREWWQIAFALLPMGATIVGVLLRWKGGGKWSSALIFTPLWVHTLIQLSMVLLTVSSITIGEFLEFLPYSLSFLLNCALLCVYWFGIRKK